MTESTTENSAITRLATDIFAPAAFESLFWRPRFLIDSPVVAHLPLLFWVCAALRPSNAAVVGADDGVAHFALCQAIEKFKGQRRCLGYGFWKDAASSGTASIIPPQLTSHQGMLYEEISHLFSSQDPDAVADKLGEGALDLIWLDLNATPEGLGQRADLFSRALSPTGVMFIHGINAISDSAALKRLMNSKRCVRFGDEKGLLLVAFDNDASTRIEALFNTSENSALIPEVERVFRRIGQGLVASVRATDAIVAKTNAEKKAAELITASKSAKDSLKTLNSAYDLKNKKFAEIQSELFDSRILVSGLRAEIGTKDGARLALDASHEKAQAEIEQQLETTTAEANDLRDKVEAAQEDRLALEARISEYIENLDAAEARIQQTENKSITEQRIRFEETAMLTSIIEDLKADHEKAQAEIEQQLETTTAEANDLRDKVEAAQEDRLALEARISEYIENLDAAEARIQQTENKSITELSTEQRIRFEETAILTSIIEGLNADKEKKNRPFENLIVKKLMWNQKKQKKYFRNRSTFFADSQFIIAKAYFRMRPGA